MNKAKAARMSRDLKFGFVGVSKVTSGIINNQIVKTYQVPKKYVNKHLMLERVRRYFDKW